MGHNGHPNYLIVDTRGGLLDGWYARQSDAEAICELWKRDLGHDDVVVLESRQTRPISDGVFMANVFVRRPHDLEEASSE